MRWFRANKRLGGRVALFALALQLVLSFGHIHREDIYGSDRLSAAAAMPAADRSQPADHSSKHGDDYCAICAVMSLLSGAYAAAPPQLAVPLASQVVAHSGRVAIAILAPPRAPFQSRAPPAA